MKRNQCMELLMLASFAVAATASAIHPHSMAVWVTEMFWAVGLLALLLATRRRFRFSTVAYLCFFSWMLLQTVGAHWTFASAAIVAMAIRRILRLGRWLAG
ncbi:MAG: DUF2238 domain-containing protein [Kiritimatiellia bacterium]